MADNPVRSRHRSTKVGRVVSCAGNKTVVVKVTRRVQHPLYRRFVNRSKKFHAHDEQNRCRVGDRVRIVETRPLSCRKRWRLQEMLYRAPVVELSKGESREESQPPASRPRSVPGPNGPESGAEKHGAGVEENSV